MRHAIVTSLAVALSLATQTAFAQATGPAPAPAAADGGMSWFWIIVLLLAVAAAVWYFGFARRRSVTSHSTGVSHDRVAGSAEQAKGSLKEGIGNVMGDSKLQAEGRTDKLEGKAQNTWGGVKDTLKGK